MTKRTDMHHAVLIVSGSGQFDIIVKKSLTGFTAIDIRRSVSQARRAVIEKDYDIVIIDSPMTDETGEEFAMDVAERSKASVMLAVTQEAYWNRIDLQTDMGIMVIVKPLANDLIDRAIRYLIAERTRIRELEKKIAGLEEKMEELRLVSQAKILLVEKKHMTEETAHRFIGKMAMNNGLTRKLVAERVIEDLSD